MQTMMAELVALEADVTRRQWKLAMMEEGLSLDHEPWEEDVDASGAADSEATPAGGGEDTYDSQVVGTLESPSSGRIPSTRGAAAIFVEAPIDPGAAAIFVEDSIDPGAAAIFVEAPIDLGAAASMVEAPIYLGAAAIQACANYEDCAEYFNMQKATGANSETTAVKKDRCGSSSGSRTKKHNKQKHNNYSFTYLLTYLLFTYVFTYLRI
jgi:hypothetical protein